MRHIITLTLAATLLSGALGAQNPIDAVLARAEQTSVMLEAQRKLVEAQKLEARTGIYLANPTVTYEGLWSGGADKERIGELAVAQGFDFPGSYTRRSRLSRLQGELHESEGDAFRQQWLMETKILCLEIIHLRQQEALLSERCENARELSIAYKRKLEAGDANIIEINKINLEHLSAKTALNLNSAALRSSLEELSQRLGGEPAGFDASEYPAEEALLSLGELTACYLDDNPTLRTLEGQRRVDEQSIALSRSLSLPQLEVGYRQNFGAEGRAKGFLVGISVPLFENKNTVKAARARTVFATAQLESARLAVTSQLNQLYEQSEALRQSADELTSLLAGQNTLPLLKRSLEAGQINLIDYFTEVNVLFESRAQLLEIERDYRICTAEMYRFRL